MLKLITPSNLFAPSQTKCGEIFYHNFNDFTIFCTFCQMKCFHFDDFLQHINNVHLENDLHPAATAADIDELDEYLQLNVKNEAELSETENILEDCMEQPLESSELDWESCSEEEKLLVLKEPRKKRKLTGRKRYRSESPEVLNEASAEEFEIQCKSSYRKEITKSGKTDKPLEFPCPECQQIFSRKLDMDSHVFEVHKGFKCSLCEARFRHRHHLRRHEEKHNPETKFTCPIEGCSKIYNDRDNMKRHMLTHNPEHSYPCPIANCKKIYSHQKYLEKHQATAHKYTNTTKVKNFVCDICGYSCSSTAVLIIHQRVHTGEKPFLCEVCEKRFVSKTGLNLHMITHSTTRPHVCEICQATFANYRILEQHKYIHSDEKTFKCKFCDKAFKQPNGLDGHVRRLHMEPKPKIDKNNKE